MPLRFKISLIFTLLIFLNAVAVSQILACTYEATIIGNHLDFTITSDSDQLRVIQYIRVSGSSIVTKMDGVDIGTPWINYNDPNCNVGQNKPLACRQNRGGGLGDGAFWQWSDDGFNNFRIMPGGVWGLDFDSPPTYKSIGIMYGAINSLNSWVFCNRTGEVSVFPNTPTPSPTSTPTPTASPTSTPSPTPTPTPSPTPTPTPSPTPIPTPTPTSSLVSKVFFVPGIGASWNLDALINCKTSGYSGDWTLAPYAKDIYQTLLETISSSGWTSMPFNYDWRRDVRDTASLLSNYINSKTSANEKVDLVGHSMGGLIGRAYLESDQGKRLAKFLAVGSPFQGSDLSYPVWSGGEVWTGNLIEKIAIDLYLDHCGGIFSNNRQTVQKNIPSIQNLLPTVDYIKNSQNNAIKPIASMSAKNNLSTSLASPFWGVKVGTIAGTGFPTINMIDVVNPSKSDTNQGNWPDGKPVSEEYSNSGDGTVLSASVQISGAINKIINATHEGLVGTTDGMSEILKFLGYPNSVLDPYVEPTSALIIIGYPGSFQVTDSSGFTTQSDNGMVAIMNPKDGEYQLQIVPASVNTTFIVSQFLASGQTEYKEYKLKGLTQDPKVIEFNSKRPQADILHEVNEYKTPKFPKLWLLFWNFWSKLRR